MAEGLQECERLHQDEQEAVDALVRRSGITYGIVTVSIHVKRRKADRVEITSRRDVVGKFMECGGAP